MRVTRIAVAVALASAAIAVTASVQGPARAASVTAKPAVPIPGALTGVSCQTDRNCLAVTVAGAAERWNGRAWQHVAVRHPAGWTGGWLAGVACPGRGSSVTECVAVGGYHANVYGPYSAAFGDAWNGRTWTPSDLRVGGVSWMTAVSCLSAARCLGVGRTGSPEGGYAWGIAESWNGTAWTARQPPVPPANLTNALDGVSCVPGSFCMVVGGAAASSPLLAYQWNGAAWRELAPATPKGLDYPAFTSVSCDSARHCVAVGGTSDYRADFAEVWNGATWSLTPPIAWPQGGMDTVASSVSCTSRSFCVAVGAVGKNLGMPTGSGRAVASVWNGRRWTAMTVPAPGKGKTSRFSAVTCLRPTFCVAVGESGKSGSAAGVTQLAGFWQGKRWRLVP